MRDMLDSGEPYPLSAWSTQFDRIRADLNDALARQAEVAVARRTPEQSQYLSSSVTQFWDASNRIFDLARSGREEEARSQIRLSLQARQAALSTLVARLLVQNNETESRRRQAGTGHLRSRAAAGVLVPGCDARRDCRDQPVPDSRRTGALFAQLASLVGRAPRASRSSSSRRVNRRCVRSRGSCTTSSASS